MSYVPNSAIPHAKAHDADTASTDGSSNGEGGIRETIDSGFEAARDAVQNVPTKAWTIGAVVAGVAASVAIGAYVAGTGQKSGRSSKSSGRQSAKRRTPARKEASAA